MAQSRSRTGQERPPSNQAGPSTRSSGASRQPEDGCLCLDSGTRASRLAFALLKETRRAPPIVHLVKRNGFDNGSRTFEESDFPAGMRPYALDERPEDCIGFIGDHPDQYPVKIYPYIVRALKLRERGHPEVLAAVQKFAETIPQLGSFLSAFDGQQSEELKAKVVDHGLAIYISHLQQLKAEAERQALAKNIRITALGATFPSNWDNWTQKWFIEILNLVWGDSIQPDAIELIQESHAAANWLMYLTDEMRLQRPTQIVLVDFGGHTCSVEAFDIIYHDEGEKFSVAAVWDPECVHAGSELHAAHVRDYVQKELTRRAASLPADQSVLFKDLMQNYHSKKLDLCRGQGFSLTCPVEPPPGTRKAIPPFEVRISMTVANRLYDLCFGKAFTALKKTLKSEAIERGTTVVFTGGTFYNDHVREEAEKMCRDAGMICPEWTRTSTTVHNSKTGRLVMGAVMCLVNAGNISDFMSRAAFALRIKHLNAVTPHLIWQRQGYTVTKRVEGGQGDDILVVCSPRGLGETVPTDGPDFALEETFFDHAYDFRILDKAKQGTYTISMVYNEANEQGVDHIVLTVEHPDSKEPTETFRWPIYFDKSGSVCFVDLEAEKNNSEGNRRSAPWRRAHGKGKKIRERWEQNHEDAGLQFWGGKLQPPADITAQEIREAVQRARRAAEAARANAAGPPTFAATSATQPVRTRPQRQTRTNRRAEAASSTTPAAQAQARAGRKRRGTSSTHGTTASRQKATNTDRGDGTANSSFTFSTLNLGANSNGEGSQTNPYAVPESPPQASLARTSDNAQGTEQGNAARAPGGPHSTQAPHPEPSREDNVQEADEVSTVQSRTRSGSAIQERVIGQREVPRSEYRLSTTQEIVSKDLGIEISSHWANLQKNTNGMK